MSLAKKAIHGVIWQGLGNYGFQGINFVTDIILARVLIPEYFGVVALALTIFNFFKMITGWGINEAMVQFEEEKEEVLSTIFWIQVILAICFLVISYFALPVLKIFFSPLVIKIFMILVLVGSFQIVCFFHGALLQKRLQLREDAIVRFISIFLSALIGISGAYLGWEVWALATYKIFNLFFSAVGYWLVCRWKPTFKFNKQVAKWYFDFGKNLFLSGNMEVIFQRLDKLIIGTLIGAHWLGLYTRAFFLAELFPLAVLPALTRTALPTFAKLKNRPDKLKQAYSLTLGLVFRSSLFFYFLLGLLIPELIENLYGKQWVSAAHIFRMLLLFAIIHPLFNISKIFLHAQGKPQIVFRARAIAGLFFIPSLFFGVKIWSVNGAALSLGFTMLISFLIIFREVVRDLKIQVLEIFVVPILAGIVSAISGVLIKQMVTGRAIFLMGFIGLIMILVYLIFLYLAEKRQLFCYREILAKGI